ncbi:hypothetical protein IJH16_03880 [Candidatus Saccharibacteria bacterium]|nr:hypothetical protein [Candidatus Saccharibacteria bacterium]
MHINVWNRNIKKFRNLLLCRPNCLIFRINIKNHFPLHRLIDFYLFILSHFSSNFICYLKVISFCPKNQGSSTNSILSRRYPLSYVFSGYYYWGPGNLYNQDSYGLWWSTAAYSDSGAYSLRMDSGGLGPQYNGIKTGGFPLRCVYYFINTRRYPLSYVYSGDYGWLSGNLYSQTTQGGWWTNLSSNSNFAYFMTIHANGINPQNNASAGKNQSFTLHFTFSRRYPLSYVFSGNYSWGNDNLSSQDSIGSWWSTAASSASDAYYLRMGSSYLLPQYDRSKAYGFALRCVSHSMLYPSVSAFVCILW